MKKLLCFICILFSVSMVCGQVSIQFESYVKYFPDYYTTDYKTVYVKVNIPNASQVFYNGSTIYVNSDVKGAKLKSQAYYSYFVGAGNENGSSTKQVNSEFSIKQESDTKLYCKKRVIEYTGYTSENSYTLFTVYSDTTAPKINATVNGASYDGKWTTGDVLISASDYGSGISYIKVDGAYVSNNYTINTSGRHKVEVVDSVGNSGEFIVKIDKTNPTVKVKTENITSK